MVQVSFRRALVAGALCFISAAASATTYTYTLVDVPGSIETYPVGLNAEGEMVGYYATAGYVFHGFVFYKNKVTTFDYPGATATQPYGVNKSGLIVGSYTDSKGKRHGFSLDSKTKKFTAINLAGSYYTTITGVNDNGVMVGNGLNSSFAQIVFTYANGTFTTIINNGSSPVPVAINNSGVVAGYNDLNNPTAWQYANGTVTILPLSAYYYSQPFALNNSGVEVGQVAQGAGVEYGFVYTGTATPGIIGETTDSFNLGVNDSGVVAGVSFTPGSLSESVGYTYDNGVYSTLTITGGTNVAAININASGQVAGNYVDANDISQVFLATPLN